MKEINLEEIIWDANRKVFDEEGYPNFFTAMQINIVRKSMFEFGKQLLELAAENAEATAEFNGYEDYTTVDKKSITDTINQVK